MSKVLESLSKDLASGVSRRKAMWKFATGLAGIAGLGLLTTKKASATSPILGECEDQAELAETECNIGCIVTICGNLRGAAFEACEETAFTPTSSLGVCLDSCDEVYDEILAFCLDSGGRGEGVV